MTQPITPATDQTSNQGHPQEPDIGKTDKNPAKTLKKYNRNYNRKNVIALKKQGLSCTDIAKIEGTSLSTITRYLDKIDPQLKEIQRYNSTKADALSLSQLKLQTVSDTILDHWIDNPDNLKSQDWRLQKEVLVAVQGAKTYEHNAERLERGKSTGNLAVVQFQMPTPQSVPPEFRDIAKVDGTPIDRVQDAQFDTV